MSEFEVSAHSRTRFLHLFPRFPSFTQIETAKTQLVSSQVARGEKLMGKKCTGRPGGKIDGQKMSLSKAEDVEKSHLLRTDWKHSIHE